MAKLTKRFIDSIRPAEKDLVLWDDDLPGFGLRIKPSGIKSFVVQYRNSVGRSRRLTLGTYGRITPADARTDARLALSEVDRGKDPVEARSEARKTLIFRDVAERYLTEHAETKKKASSVRDDRRLLTKIILPALGSKRIDAIARADVARLHHSLRESPYQANRVLSLLSKMFNLAEAWGLRTDTSNPCRHVQRYKENSRKRYLSQEELARLGEALRKAEQEHTEHVSVITALRLLLFTGCRSGEILSLMWDHVALESSFLLLPDSKTGEKQVVLNAAAIDILRSTPRVVGNPYVCWGSKAGGHFTTLSHPWARLCKAAGIAGVRVHDLRHSFASTGVGINMSLPTIGALLGHTQAATTQRYAHLAVDPLRVATDEIGQKIKAAMDRPPAPQCTPAEVLHLRRKEG